LLDVSSLHARRSLALDQQWKMAGRSRPAQPTRRLQPSTFSRTSAAPQPCALGAKAQDMADERFSEAACSFDHCGARAPSHSCGRSRVCVWVCSVLHWTHARCDGRTRVQRAYASRRLKVRLRWNVRNQRVPPT
jgi:hypothetical protein